MAGTVAVGKHTGKEPASEPAADPKATPPRDSDEIPERDVVLIGASEDAMSGSWGPPEWLVNARI